MKQRSIEYHFFPSDTNSLIKQIGKETLLHCLKQMLLIRNFEIRAESAYLQGKVGGFFHSYMGQEPIQTAAVQIMGRKQWWITSYRCHALALLLGATPNELMAELYGRQAGNAKGRGGSMHFYTDRMLGGFGIVTGQVPVATGAAFSMKYLKQDGVAICFMGEGAVAQGSLHESLNIASLWDLPCIYVVENNQWGMGTAVSRAICAQPIAEKQAPSYNMKGYSLDGMDFFNCYAGFSHIFEETKKTSRPALIEVVTQRFKGHSISDPGLYRSKEDLAKCMEKDPILSFYKTLSENGLITEAEYEAMDKEQKELVVAAMKFADESPWPDPMTLGEDVFAP
ncbi:MAG TPA: pyruvate dehydrogenase (acetyl-transferring) E1 component subunit alpha [Rhabdochlamydiaceae bacterium]|jgi:pyruvate dehydrogenase E1 component alpha subunit|nr:pyruvate dehydrogenase (acetyl-transferring) E1 component subunit alpha [Rhabdochlamydiaceae bacterium]